MQGERFASRDRLREEEEEEEEEEGLFKGGGGFIYNQIKQLTECR